MWLGVGGPCQSCRYKGSIDRSCDLIVPKYRVESIMRSLNSFICKWVVTLSEVVGFVKSVKYFTTNIFLFYF